MIIFVQLFRFENSELNDKIDNFTATNACPQK